MFESLRNNTLRVMVHYRFKITLPFWRSHGVILTIDEKNIEYVLKTNYRNYLKPAHLRESVQEFIGDGIFRINHGTCVR